MFSIGRHIRRLRSRYVPFVLLRSPVPTLKKRASLRPRPHRVASASVGSKTEEPLDDDTIARLLEDAISGRESSFFDDCSRVEFKEDISMVCGQLQLACDNIGVRSGIVSGVGGSGESLLILPELADGASRVEEIIARTRCQAGMPPFSVASQAERPAFYVTAEEHQGIVPCEHELQNVYWGVAVASAARETAAEDDMRTTADRDSAPSMPTPKQENGLDEEDLLVPPGGWENARFI